MPLVGPPGNSLSAWVSGERLFLIALPAMVLSFTPAHTRAGSALPRQRENQPAADTSVPSDRPSAAAQSSEPQAAPPSGGPPPAMVITDAVRRESVEQLREVTGELRASKRSVLAAEQEGQVETLTIEAGDAVAAGQVLATLDGALIALEVERAKATVKAREATLAERRALLEQARRDLARVQQSYERQSASQSELDSAETRVLQSDAQVSEAQAEVAWAKSDQASASRRLNDMTIRAPFAGVVIDKRTEVGQWLSAGDPVVDLVALDPIDAWLDVPEALLPRVQPQRTPANGGAANAAEIEVRFPGLADARRRAPISAVIAAGERLSRLFPARVRLANSDGQLRPGMSVIGVLPTGTRTEALTVHKDGVIFGDGPGAARVWIDAGGMAAPISVSVLWPTADGTRLVVQAERLTPGTPVIVEGNERLFPGQPLQSSPRRVEASPE